MCTDISTNVHRYFDKCVPIFRHGFYEIVETSDRTDISTTRNFDMSKYRYVFVDIAVHICRNIGTSKYRYVDIAVRPLLDSINTVITKKS